MNQKNNIAILLEDPTLLIKAQKMAEKLQLPIVMKKDHNKLFLTYSAAGLFLQDQKNNMVNVNFFDPKIQFRLKNQKKELILKACGCKKHRETTIIDATAGWGMDTLILLSAGNKVIMVERNNIVYELLKDGFKKYNDQTLKYQLHNVDAKTYLVNLKEDKKPDVIYLDPMRAISKTAKSKKEMMILRSLIGTDDDYKELIEIAHLKARKRVVIKKHNQEARISQKKPDILYVGKNTTFEVFVKA